ncbi:cyclic nucleotide-binding domain-containing protein [Microvirga puerhi]|uniref:Cyclic nucleotide-binding domain-containing protein n=1 Tax=Microvirga puerhi TaxID=2876078 RepID=A0ABS7VN88_9HYPH|nr:cyclic nucleotide-binding domain-containing protein [Microvirga puerhi]MBZ6076999.1 cyclic nucleotide-binding domain-containing protein [Microvirga puerhi]
MALEDDIAILSSAPLFSLLNKDALRLVAFAAESRKLREGDTLFRKGDRSDGGYVVSSGTIALDAREDGTAADFVLGPGSLIGQAALFARIERPATAVAREAATVIRVSPSLMRRVLEEFPTAAAAMHDAMAEELDRLTKGLEQVRRKLIAIDGQDEA